MDSPYARAAALPGLQEKSEQVFVEANCALRAQVAFFVVQRCIHKKITHSSIDMYNYAGGQTCF
jgi:hypothetical protein